MIKSQRVHNTSVKEVESQRGLTGLQRPKLSCVHINSLSFPLPSVSCTGNTQEGWKRETNFYGRGLGEGVELNHKTPRKLGPFKISQSSLGEAELTWTSSRAAVQCTSLQYPVLNSTFTDLNIFPGAFLSFFIFFICIHSYKGTSGNLRWLPEGLST